MFLSLIKFFRGFLLVQLSGYSPERFLNLCSHHNILIWNLSNQGEFYEFYISIAGYRKLKPLLKKTKTRLVIKKRVGFPFFLYRYRKRKMYFAGIFFCIGFLCYLTTFIWLIDINGNSLITDENVLNFLEQHNSAFGTSKKEIDCEGLEEALRTEFPDIIWASVRLSGTKLTVDLQENLIAKQDTGEENRKPEGAYDITADKDAVITSIITRKGTPAVKAKDMVKKGDLLVGSRLDIYNDSDEISDYIYVTADADIMGQTTYCCRDSFPLHYTKKVKIGEGKHIYQLSMFSYQIKLPFSYQKKEPFVAYTQNQKLAIAKDYYIPVTLEKTTCYDCGYQNISLSKEQAKAKANQNIARFLKNLEEKGIQITDKNVMIEFKDDRCFYTAEITALEKIGRYEPAEILKITDKEEKERLTEHESD